MNIRNIFGCMKKDTLENFDNAQEQRYSKEEAADARRLIADRFEELFDVIQEREDAIEKMEADIRRDNELIRMLCKGRA